GQAVRGRAVRCRRLGWHRSGGRLDESHRWPRRGWRLCRLAGLYGSWRHADRIHAAIDRSRKEDWREFSRQSIFNQKQLSGSIVKRAGLAVTYAAAILSLSAAAAGTETEKKNVDGKWETADGTPTYHIAEDGTVDWY